MFAPALFLALTALVSAAKPLDDPTGVAFDRAGNLWVCNYYGHTLLEYSPSQLTATGSPTPVRIVRGVRGPNNLAVDPQGNVWAAEYDGGSVAEYRDGRLAVRIRFSRNVLSSPTGLAFDRTGTLWVTSQRSGELAGFTPAQLRTSGLKNPGRTIELPAGQGANNQSVAFDRDGGMWLAQWGRNRVLGYKRGARTPSRILRLDGKGPLGVTPQPDGRIWIPDASSNELTVYSAPARLLTFRSDAFANPHSIAFDASGRLWVTNSNDTVIGFAPDALAGGATVTPSIVISNP